MKRRALLLPALLVATLILAPAHANAPADQYVTFDATSTVITDAFTLLSWQRDGVSAGLMTQGEATTYCAQLSLGGYATGWRLPTYKELMTLVDEVPHADTDSQGNSITVAIDANAFGYGENPLVSLTPNAAMWSSSLYAPAPGSAWAIDFSSGEAVNQTIDSGAYVRCVHD